MNAAKSIKMRKSPETFFSSSLKKEDIQTIAEAGCYAPIFGKIHLTVIDSHEMMREISRISIEMMKQSGNEFAEKMARTPGYDPVRNARTAIVLSALDGNDPNGFNMANVSCAAENIILTATELGIGSRFAMGPVMSLSQEPLQSKLSLPERYIPLVMVLLGNAEMPEEERLKTITNITYL